MSLCYRWILVVSIWLNLLSVTVLCIDNTPIKKCHDSDGNVVSDGELFTPQGSDPCFECTCVDGKHEKCISLLCSPPRKCENQKPSLNKCCEFVCQEVSDGNETISINKGGSPFSTTNLGLRLVASTVTSFLILALLLFMIHRLRQRRLLLMIRRLNNERINGTSNDTTHRYSVDGDIGVGYYVGRDQVDFYGYGDPPPPYTLWKPPDVYIPPGEAPPPYEASVNAAIPPYSSFTPNPIYPSAMVTDVPQFHLTAIQPVISQSEVQHRASNHIDNHILGQVGSLSSVSSQEDAANDHDNVLRSDDRYERLNCNPATVQESNQTTNSIANCVPTSIIDSEPSSLQNKYELIDDSLRRSVDDSNQRKSFQRETDPIGWGTVTSDTSSSSASPTCERTISPTSSDSSSILDFVLPDDEIFNHNASRCRRSLHSVGYSRCYHHRHHHHPYKQPKHPSATTSSLDRTLRHLKRFSLIMKKAKCRDRSAGADNSNVASTSNSTMTQSQCSTVSNPETGNWLSSVPNDTPDNLYRQRRLQDRPSSLYLSRLNDNGKNGVENLPDVSAGVDSADECSAKNRNISPGVINIDESLSRSGSICSETGERKHRMMQKSESSQYPFRQSSLNGRNVARIKSTSSESLTSVKLPVASFDLGSSSKQTRANFKSRNVRGDTKLLQSHKSCDLTNANDGCSSERNYHKQSTSPEEWANRRQNSIGGANMLEDVWVPICHNRTREQNRVNGQIFDSWQGSQESKI